MKDNAQRNFWTLPGRLIVLILAASSIACLLLDFYGLCSMRRFVLFAFVPALLLLAGLAITDRYWGNRELCRAVTIGLWAGLLAAIAYDVFRLPFVYARPWGLVSFIPPLDLFKVFPRFGAMILGEPGDQSTYSSAAHIVGWIYHFSNGATFGVMYVAMVGMRRSRSWFWGVLMALILELGMLFSPYPTVFSIPLTPQFILITLAAHFVFGSTLGWEVRRLVKFPMGSSVFDCEKNRLVPH